MKNYQRILSVTGGLALAVFFISKCMNGGGATATVDVRGVGYAGAAACGKCHNPLADSFWHSAHALTSRAADINSVMGSFAPTSNLFDYAGGRRVVMEQRDSGLFQVATLNAGAAGDTAVGGSASGREEWPARDEAHRFDIAIGSGRKAQTYLYWKGDEAFQLPVSYFVAANSWANSPNYPMDSIWFGRVVARDCFGCHSSFIKEKEAIRRDAFHSVDQFDSRLIVYGIDCERCHGPGAPHVEWQSGHPQDRVGRYIASYPRLSRQAQLDMCSICHSGLHSMQRSAFLFQPGDSLSRYFYPEMRIAGDASALDVHGNQAPLLEASQCFLQSKTLVCTSCHDPHVKERDDLALFSVRCMNCHGAGATAMAGEHGGSTGAAEGGHGAGATAMADGEHGAGTTTTGRAPFCGLSGTIDAKILVANCIDCHMPALPSRAITMVPEGQKTPMADLVRSHLIKIYPAETKKFLAALKKK